VLIIITKGVSRFANLLKSLSPNYVLQISSSTTELRGQDKRDPVSRIVSDT